MKKLLPILFIAGIAFGFAISETTKLFDQSDVKASQRLIGVDFTDAEIDTMFTYLERNRKGFDSMRTRPLNPNVVPSMVFTPFPVGIEIPENEGPIDWKIDESIKLPKKKKELAYYPVWKLAGLIKSKKITSLELTQLYLDRIKKYDDKLLSFVTVTEDLAIAQAKKADKEIAAGNYKGILHGIPYGVKDLAAVPNYPTTWGAEAYKDQIIDETATLVQNLENAGAVLLGKLVSGTLARGDVWFGGKTKNPWDLEQGASGSSAGPGSATSAGLVAFSIGTETLGSIVSPSTRCGITGLRPTYGRVSRAGVMALSWSMDKAGPMARDARDCAIILDAIRGIDGVDMTVVDAGFGYSENVDISKMKIGYFYEQFENDSSDNSVNNDATLATIRTLGVDLEKVELPKDFPFNAFDIILRAEAGAFFDELILTRRDSLLVEQHKRSRANSLRQARFIPAVEYLQANRHRRLLIEDMHEKMQGYDLVISPTFGGRQMLITNLSGHPAMAIPNGFDEKGRPTSITLVGNFFDEAKLIAFAEAFQDATDFEEKHPPLFMD
ncbi:MAG: amidase [Cyclobacteriaceae bacterium]